MLSGLGYIFHCWHTLILSIQQRYEIQSEIEGLFFHISLSNLFSPSAATTNSRLGAVFLTLNPFQTQLQCCLSEGRNVIRALGDEQNPSKFLSLCFRSALCSTNQSPRAPFPLCACHHVIFGPESSHEYYSIFSIRRLCSTTSLY